MDEQPDLASQGAKKSRLDQLRETHGEEYQPPMPPCDAHYLVTYLNEPGLPPSAADFQILVDGTPVGRYEPNADAIGYYDAQYPVPPSRSRGKRKVTVRFQAGPSGRVVPVFGVRTIRTP